MLLLVQTTDALEWHAQPFHVAATSNETLFHVSDVHEISVNIADKLGATATATVHCVNGTIDDYSIDLIVTNLHDRFNETLYNGTLQLGGGASLPSKLSYGTSIGVIPQPAVLAAYNKSDPTESKPIVILIYGPNPPSWPTQKVVPLQYPLFKQCDPRWGNNTIKVKTICAVGCLMTSITMALRQRAVLIDGKDANPGNLNAWLLKHGGYDAHDDLNEVVVDGLDPTRIFWNDTHGMHKTNDLTYADIVARLKDGRPTIANVMHGHHFVLVVGYDAAPGSTTLYVHDSGFNRSTYDFLDDVVGWRLYEMTRSKSAFPPTGAAWTRVKGEAGAAVLTPSLPWEGVAAGHPCVVEPQAFWHPPEQKWLMYYRGGWDVGGIGLAHSTDGRAWTKRTRPVFGANGSGYAGSAMQPWVVAADGSGTPWRLFTSTWHLGPKQKTSTTNIASSTDGIVWAIEPKAHVPLPTGANAKLFGNRAVWRESQKWLMLQEVGIPAAWAIYLYTSDDGLVWNVSNGGKPLHALQRHEGGMYGGPSIASVDGVATPKGPDGKYHVWYHAASAAGNLPTDVYHASAASLDGPWEVSPAGPVLHHEGSGFEYDQVADPSPTVRTGKGAMLFYDGDDNVKGQCSIGAAVAVA